MVCLQAHTVQQLLSAYLASDAGSLRKGLLGCVERIHHLLVARAEVPQLLGLSICSARPMSVPRCRQRTGRIHSTEPTCVLGHWHGVVCAWRLRAAGLVCMGRMLLQRRWADQHRRAVSLHRCWRGCALGWRRDWRGSLCCKHLVRWCCCCRIGLLCFHGCRRCAWADGCSGLGRLLRLGAALHDAQGQARSSVSCVARVLCPSVQGSVQSSYQAQKACRPCSQVLPAWLTGWCASAAAPGQRSRAQAQARVAG